MDIFTYLMVRKGHNLSYNDDLVSYLMAKDKTGTYTTKEGLEIIVNNSLIATIKDWEFSGNSSQFSTTGKNFIPTQPNNWEQGTIIESSEQPSTTRLRTKDYYPIEPDTTYYISIQNSNYCYLNILLYDNNKQYVGQYYNIDNSINGAINKQINIPISNVAYMRVTLRNTDNVSTILPSDIENIKPQIELGNTKTNWEPYTGGIPAPNPDYPYPVKTVTRENNLVISNKNLLDYNMEVENYFYNSEGIKTYDANNTYINQIIKINNQDITFSALNVVGSASIRICEFSNDNIFIKRTLYGVTEAHLTLNANTSYIIVSINKSSTNYFTNPQLEKGPTATDYVAHEEQNYQLSLGNIELCKVGDYQDYIYKSGDNWYKKEVIRKYVLNGSENWENQFDDSLFDVQQIFDYRPFIVGYGLSNYYKYNPIQTGILAGLNNGEFALQKYSTSYNIFIRNNNYTTVADFKNWLSTHNTEVYYIRETPLDFQITDETLISQLNNIYNNAYSYKGTTNITSTYEDGNEQMYLKLKIKTMN